MPTMRMTRTNCQQTMTNYRMRRCSLKKPKRNLSRALPG
jgi:hypothetical protein